MTDQRTEPYTTAEMAKLRRCNETTLRSWRSRGKGPPWHYANGESGKVLYDAEEYRKWDAAQKAKNKRPTG